MRSFKDRTGRQWTVDITVATVERVKAECGIDMPGLFADRMAPLDALLADPMKLTEVIFACCRPGEATLVDLRAEWEGTTADEALACWLEGELIGFFPDPRKRKALLHAITSIREVGQQVTDLAMEEMSPEAIKENAQKAYQLLKQNLSAIKSGGSSGSLPATSELTPDHSPSANST